MCKYEFQMLKSQYFLFLKVQAYNTRLKEWTVEVPLSQPRHKSCAVTIDSYVVLTGGTSLGLGKYKPQWLAEIGTRKTEMFDGQTWTPLPSMNRAKVLITVHNYET